MPPHERSGPEGPPHHQLSPAHSVTDPSVSILDARADLAERLPELARQYTAVVELPDQVETLWRAYHEQQRVLLGMAVVMDRLADRLERLEWRRDRGR
jgi:hypothetical protein